MQLTDRQIEILKLIKTNPDQFFPIDNEDIILLKNYGYIYCSEIPAKRTDWHRALEDYPAPTQVKCSLLDKAHSSLAQLRKEDTEERRHAETLAVAKEANAIADNANKIANRSNVLSIFAICISLFVGVISIIDIIVRACC